MTTIILFFSVIINLFTIFAIIILYLRQNRFTAMEFSQKQAMKEMEDVFTAYLEDLKEENEQFIERLNSFQKIQSTIQPLKTTQSNTTKADKQKDNIEEMIPHAYKRLNAVKSYNNKIDLNNDSAISSEPETKELKSTEPLSIQDQVVSLSKKGLTIDEIAQNLNKGKTEIDLILKFIQKNSD
ncbi:hypothetical protein ACQKP0_05785 [Heyndrickxia sp. NPDC080065]|uniref:hypothetical protein n=1 Tax=Heyndrickxia sp. NPDC080065 TaxID=3390568 RepID=UPI003D07B2D1